MKDHPMFRSAIIVCAVVFLGGCSTIKYYSAPAGLNSENAATITGDKIENQKLDAANIVSYPTKIDDAYTSGSPSAWNRAILVSEGEHYLESRVVIGDRLKRYASLKVTVNFQRGRIYTVRISPHDDITAIAWVEDEHGQAVTEKVPVTGFRPVPSPIFIPMAR